jgi:purine-binding chemotaxis protein CheW
MRAVETLQIVVFALGGEEFGIDITHVREIDRMMSITRVPRVPGYVAGVINLRGQLVPVVDLRARLEMAPTAPTKHSRIIVAEIGPRTIGMIVDEVREVVRIPADDVDPSAGALEGFATEYVGALAKVDQRPIILLDVSRLLAGSAPVPSEALVHGADKETS